VSDAPFGTNAIYAIAYGDGSFVIVGYKDRIAHSHDGISWELINNGTYTLYGLAYGGGKFVAAGDNGLFRYTTDITARLVFKSDGTVGWVKAQG
jgi:hypothetical protein